MVWRQLEAAIARSAGFSSTWTSFWASPKVVGETSGPAPGPVPNAGGIPAGGAARGSCALLAPKPIAAPAHPMVARKSLRDSDILPPETVSHCIASGHGSALARAGAAFWFGVCADRVRSYLAAWVFF